MKAGSQVDEYAGTVSRQVGEQRAGSACLLPSSMSQHATMLEDEQGFCDSRLLGGALLRLAPLERLNLDLPVDASKAAALL